MQPGNEVKHHSTSLDYLSQDDIVRLALKLSTSRRRPKNDMYFVSTNTLVGIDIVPGLQRLGVHSTIEKQELTTVNTKTLCNVPGCNRNFDTVLAYDRHYSRLHRFQCSQCHRMLPSGHLLDLHLSEQHDSFFAAQLSAYPDRAFYACFIKECNRSSLTPEKRRDHCISDHSFPSNYRFETHKPLMASASGGTTSGQAKPLQSINGQIRFVNFGHSNRKTFVSTNLNDNVEDYAKVLTKGQRRKSGEDRHNKSQQEPYFTDLSMVDVMDCLDDM